MSMLHQSDPQAMKPNITPRPVPEAGIARWTRDGYLWSARDRDDHLLWDVSDVKMQRVLAGEPMRHGIVGMSGDDIIRRAFGPEPEPATREPSIDDETRRMMYGYDSDEWDALKRERRVVIANIGDSSVTLTPDKPVRPTYRVPAREVVPGMQMHGKPITRVWRDSQQYHGEVRASWCTTTATGAWMNYTPWPLDKEVTVSLPGLSPRELCCTCPGREHMASLEPQWHDVDHDCPVAPRPGVHGGMRLWPALWRGHSWTVEHDDENELVFVAGIMSAEVWEIRQAGNAPSDGYYSRAHADAVLQAFYLPPAPEPEARRVVPVDVDIELEMVAARWGR